MGRSALPISSNVTIHVTKKNDIHVVSIARGTAKGACGLQKVTRMLFSLAFATRRSAVRARSAPPINQRVSRWPPSLTLFLAAA